MSPDEDAATCPACWRVLHRQHEELCAHDDPICQSCCDEGRHYETSAA